MAGKAAKRAKRPRPLREHITGEEAAAAILRGEVVLVRVEECVDRFGPELVASLIAGDLVAYANEREQVPFLRSDDLAAWMMAHRDNAEVARYIELTEARVLH